MLYLIHQFKIIDPVLNPIHNQNSFGCDNRNINPITAIPFVALIYHKFTLFCCFTSTSFYKLTSDRCNRCVIIILASTCIVNWSTIFKYPDFAHIPYLEI